MKQKQHTDWAMTSRLISAYLDTCRVCNVAPTWEGFMRVLQEKRVG
jgi:hypothetical protein